MTLSKLINAIENIELNRNDMESFMMIHTCKRTSCDCFEMTDSFDNCIYEIGYDDFDEYYLIDIFKNGDVIYTTKLTLIN